MAALLDQAGTISKAGQAGMTVSGEAGHTLAAAVCLVDGEVAVGAVFDYIGERGSPFIS